jgi:hypothetical protein
MNKTALRTTSKKRLISTGQGGVLEHEERLRIIKETLLKPFTTPGQGSTLEQIDKLVRRAQREELFEMIEGLSEEEVKNWTVTIRKVIGQPGKKGPMILRYELLKWRGYDEVFWRALCDYIILALHRVNDVDYTAKLGRITIKYFPKTEGRIRTPKTNGQIIQRIAYMVDKGILKTDFSRFRSMSEKGEKLGDISKTQAAALSILLKFV